jgi:hypothetical protein
LEISSSGKLRVASFTNNILFMKMPRRTDRWCRRRPR